jgi:aryl-alcohol dehydrogenase-like predicted oxidoreductase
MNDKGFSVVEKLDELAKARNLSVLQVALAWQLNLPYITAPIIGANNPAQLQDSLGAVDVKLSSEEMDALNQVSAWAD